MGKEVDLLFIINFKIMNPEKESSFLPKKEREIVEIKDREEWFKEAPHLRDFLEKLTDPNLSTEEIEKMLFDYNAKAEDLPPGEIKRYAFTTENGITIELCKDEEGRIAFNWSK